MKTICTQTPKLTPLRLRKHIGSKMYRRYYCINNMDTKTVINVPAFLFAKAPAVLALETTSLNTNANAIPVDNNSQIVI